MLDVIGYVQKTTPVQSDRGYDIITANRQHLLSIVEYKNLVDNWDEDGAAAPTHQTVTIALDIVLLLTAAGQGIYHTSPGPNGEIMINLRNGHRSAEFLIYPGDRRKFVCIGPDEIPKQGNLTPDSLRETLQWLNAKQQIRRRRCSVSI